MYPEFFVVTVATETVIVWSLFPWKLACSRGGRVAGLGCVTFEWLLFLRLGSLMAGRGLEHSPCGSLAVAAQPVRSRCTSSLAGDFRSAQREHMF